MAIPESQLETWSKQGSITQSSSTYGTIKRALESTQTPYYGKQFEVFLQGSYGNDTNIYGESDVDIVIRLDSCFNHDLSGLSLQESTAFQSAYTDAIYTHRNFQVDVLRTLKDAFGSDAQCGTKAITIQANGSRRSADVIVAVQFRRYRKFSNIMDEDYELGICFFCSNGTRIVNYPKQHSANCTAKHQATGARFKPTIRIVKNLRTRLVNDGVIQQAIAPSYFLEGLLYNVPDDKFVTTCEDTMVNAINWIRAADRAKFVCPNWQYYLLGDGAMNWPPGNCDLFLEEVVKLWRNWS